MSRKPVTVSLPEALVKQTTRFCKKRSVTLSEITREAIEEYLHRQTLEEARQAFTIHAQKRGLFTEQDLLRRLG
jgi:metal-responsive CopG/Arc/MetJ family transcriptional regulator